MNTKIVMSLCSVFLIATGVFMTFLPEILLNALNIEPQRIALVLIQVLGALYFAFGMLNWMSKGALIGGIYNRPIAVANFTHFFIAGLALTKTLFSDPGLSGIIWVAAFLYIVFGLLFGLMLFRHPIKETNTNN